MRKVLVAGKKIVVILSLAGLFAGCSTAGPFITNISSDGKGNLIIEKNTVTFNSFTGTVYTGSNPSTTLIQVVPEDVLDKTKEKDKE